MILLHILPFLVTAVGSSVLLSVSLFHRSSEKFFKLFIMSRIIIKNVKKYDKLLRKLKRKQVSINELLNKISNLDFEIILSESEQNPQNQCNKN